MDYGLGVIGDSSYISQCLEGKDLPDMVAVRGAQAQDIDNETMRMDTHLAFSSRVASYCYCRL